MQCPNVVRHFNHTETGARCMTEWTDNELATLRKVIAKAEQDPDFSPADVKSLREMMEAFRGFQYLGRFTKWAIFILAALAGAITAWDQITERLRSWLGS